ncbi:MAG: hypothetical protein WAN04_14425, partial [Candidatus Udaeobacter sp.]
MSTVTDKLNSVLAHRSALGLVAPAKEIGSYCRQAEERANGILPEAYLRARLVVPTHRYLLDKVTESLRDEEHFGVKAPIVNDREGEECLSGLVTEALEPAGHVGDPRCRYKVRQPGEA